jgi:hypothetical protein
MLLSKLYPIFQPTEKIILLLPARPKNNLSLSLALLLFPPGRREFFTRGVILATGSGAIIFNS